MPQQGHLRCTGQREGSRCGYPRQLHPLHTGTLLLCAWPGCSEGTAQDFIHVTIERRSITASARIVQYDRESAGDPSGPPYRWREPRP